MEKLNYHKLMAHNPDKIGQITNQRGQKIEFYEHPTKGDMYPVIAVYHKEKIAIATNFWDLGDFFEGSHYNPVYMHGEFQCAYLFDL